jgi:SAM-dependent methyltransferase
LVIVMPDFDSSSHLHRWLTTPLGQYVLAWEQAQLDEQVSDIFGYHAIQLGWPELDALKYNRMPQQWLAQLDCASQARAALVTDSVALPFADASLDLVVLPHTLELSSDPHATLREVERVLVAEGRVIICGFNPASGWGLRRQLAQGLPRRDQMIGLWRLRDWLRLLSFEPTQQLMGCYRPALRTTKWLERLRWMDQLGPRVWPFLGAVYCVVAVKRVRGARLMGPAWKRPTQVKTSAVTTVSKEAK